MTQAVCGGRKQPGRRGSIRMTAQVVLASHTVVEVQSPQAHRQIRVPISWQARLLNGLLKNAIKPVLEQAAVSAGTMRLARGIYQLTGPFMSQVPDFVRIRRVDFEHCYGEWLRAGKRVREDRVIYYLHGGGYFFSSVEQHRPLTWRLAHACHRPVFAMNYRKAPQYQFQHWLEDALTGYRYLLNMGYKSENIIIGGDSAGGNLTLILMQALKFYGIALPAAAICISPWTDVGCEGSSMHSNREHDPMFPASTVAALGKHFGRECHTWHPWVSPVHADMTGLPPLLVMVGSTEVLRDDAARLAERAQALGVPVVYEEWGGMPHVFPLFAFLLPEAQRAYRHIARFVNDVEKLHAEGGGALH